MTDETTRPGDPAEASPRDPDHRPAYERPRVVRKRAVTRATLFTGGGGPSSAPPPLVANG